MDGAIGGICFGGAEAAALRLHHRHLCRGGSLGRGGAVAHRKLSPAVELLTPAGIRVTAELEEVSSGSGWASCAVRKDGGDDIDATHGTLIFVRVERMETPGVTIDGGDGVGR